MKKQIVQLHASPEELVNFSNNITKDFGLYFVLINYRPFSVERKSSLAVSDVPSRGCIIYFSGQEVNIKASSNLKFLDLNPGVIGLNIGEHNDLELRESALSSISTTEDEYKLAKKIINRLRKLTVTGATIIGSDGKEYKYPNIRYTEGAKELYDKGVKMLAFAGTNYYEFKC